MNSILKQLQDPKSFQTYIDEYMKTSTYTAEWKKEMKPVEYCAAKVYQANIAKYTAAMVGSVVAKNGERPLHTMPDWGQITGSIGRIADEWELDNDYLEQMHYLEGKFKDMSGSNYTQSVLNAAYDKLITYSFRPFERAVIAPHKRIDMLYLRVCLRVHRPFLAPIMRKRMCLIHSILEYIRLAQQRIGDRLALLLSKILRDSKTKLRRKVARYCASVCRRIPSMLCVRRKRLKIPLSSILAQYR